MENKMDINDRIVVWGAGYIGLTTAIAFAEKGIKSVIYEIDQNKIQKIRNGEFTIPNLEYWCGYNYSFWFKNEIIEIAKYNDEVYSNINFIAVPTVLHMQPCFNFIENVMYKIIESSKKSGVSPIIIIESTLSPGTMDEKIIPLLEGCLKNIGYTLCIAPRRDWFVSAEKKLTNIPRIFACVNKKDEKIIYDILSIICSHLICAHNYHSAEAVKSIENVFRYVNISIANQLALAFPNIDIIETLELAGTKWNIDTYSPTFGIGGYCIPLSAKYLMESACVKRNLSIIENAFSFNQNYIKDIFSEICIDSYKVIGILGLSYKSDLQVPDGSPTIELATILREKYSKKVYINDPYFTNDEIVEITGCHSFEFPKDLYGLDCIIIVTAHRFFISYDRSVLIKNLKENVLILDGTGCWENYFKENEIINYKRIGRAGWCIDSELL